MGFVLQETPLYRIIDRNVNTIMQIFRNAILSTCSTYRYELTRTWDSTKPRLLFIMLNPSKADAMIDDPTIRKCVGFAERMGFGGITVVNLFAYRATDPADLARAGFPVGPRNNDTITKALWAHRDVVLAWGAHARKHRELTGYVTTMASLSGARVHVLRRLADGVPEHPLMLPYALATHHEVRGG